MTHQSKRSMTEPMAAKSSLGPKKASTTPVTFAQGIPPLVAALKDAADKGAKSFNFPGHNRGRAAPSSITQIIGKEPFIHDFSSLPELGNLFGPSGPILEAQKKAAELFGSTQTWFLVGGTTCGIQAAVMATCSPGDHIIISRSSHISVISGIVFSGALPKYIIPEYNREWEEVGAIAPAQVEHAIKELEIDGKNAAAVLITSPNYSGICSNVYEIACICHLYGIPVIVDEAHGAHFGFHPELPSSALQQGADLVVQSTHKVLSSLTQSSMLHMSGNIVNKEKIQKCLQLVQSTSPSYLLLGSLDAARAQLSENPKGIFSEAIKLAKETRNLINKIPGLQVLSSPSFSNSVAVDPLRITIGMWRLSLSGYEANEFLIKDHGVIAELARNRSLTIVINLGTSNEHVQKLLSGLHYLYTNSSQFRLGKKRLEEAVCLPFEDFTLGINPREAFFAIKRKVAIRESIGEICGELVSPFPPGVPVLIPGEIITAKALDYLEEVKKKGALINGASDPSLSSITVCSMQP